MLVDGNYDIRPKRNEPKISSFQNLHTMVSRQIHINPNDHQAQVNACLT